MLTYHLPCVVPMKAWSTLNGPRFFFNSTRKLGFQGDERNQVASIFSISYVGVWSRHYRDFLKTWNVIKDNVLKSFCSYGWARNSHAYPFIPVIGQDWPPEVRDDREFCVTKILHGPTLGHVRCSRQKSLKQFSCPEKLCVIVGIIMIPAHSSCKGWILGWIAQGQI